MAHKDSLKSEASIAFLTAVPAGLFEVMPTLQKGAAGIGRLAMSIHAVYTDAYRKSLESEEGADAKQKGGDDKAPALPSKEDLTNAAILMKAFNEFELFRSANFPDLGLLIECFHASNGPYPMDKEFPNAPTSKQELFYFYVSEAFKPSILKDQKNKVIEVSPVKRELMDRRAAAREDSPGNFYSFTGLTSVSELILAARLIILLL